MIEAWPQHSLNFSAAFIIDFQVYSMIEITAIAGCVRDSHKIGIGNV